MLYVSYTAYVQIYFVLLPKTLNTLDKTTAVAPLIDCIIKGAPSEIKRCLMGH